MLVLPDSHIYNPYYMFLVLQNTEVKAFLKRKLGLKNGKALTGSNR